MFTENNGKFLIRPVAGDSVRIAIAGDVCPRYSGEDYLLEGNAGKLLSGIQPVLDDADLRIVQWETVISDTPAPTVKCGPNLIVKPGCESFLTAGKFDIALMANNHTGDHGDKAVIDTLNTLHANNIRTVGAGIDAADAAKPLRFEKNGIKFSCINICEMEFGTAREDHPGANAMREF